MDIRESEKSWNDIRVIVSVEICIVRGNREKKMCGNKIIYSSVIWGI